MSKKCFSFTMNCRSVSITPLFFCLLVVFSFTFFHFEYGFYNPVICQILQILRKRNCAFSPAQRGVTSGGLVFTVPATKVALSKKFQLHYGFILFPSVCTSLSYSSLSFFFSSLFFFPRLSLVLSLTSLLKHAHSKNRSQQESWICVL